MLEVLGTQQERWAINHSTIKSQSRVTGMGGAGRRQGKVQHQME